MLQVAVVLGIGIYAYAQTPPTNLAGAEFPCNYSLPEPNTIKAKFFETINDVTFLNGDVEFRRGNTIIRADSAMCNANGECELSGKVKAILTAPQPAIK
jgi:hypothetical protein